MAAELDHRSPDASQWGVGSPVDSSAIGAGVFSTGSGVGEREGGRGGGNGRLARGRCGVGGGSGGSPSAGSRRAGATGTSGTTAVDVGKTARVKTAGVGVATQEAWGRRRGGNGGGKGAGASGGSAGGGHVPHRQQLRRQEPGYRDSRHQPRRQSHSLARERQQRQQRQQQRQGETPPQKHASRGRGGQETGRNDGLSGVDTMEMESPELHGTVADAGAVISSGVTPSDSSGAGAATAGSAAAALGLEERGQAHGGESQVHDAGAAAAAAPAAAEGAGAQRGRPASERLAHKLSVNLIDTYKLINQRYYAEKTRQQEQVSAAPASTAAAAAGGDSAGAAVRKSSSGKPPARQGGVYNYGMDDENFDYIVHEGEVFQDRYAVREIIGKGSFGKVYKAWDTRDKIYVALKVIKSKRPFTMQAKVEVNILMLLRERDPEGKYNCARMLDEFMSHNHQCLVFEILSFNLYELLRSTQFQGVSLHLVRKFARHLLRALAFLSLPQVDVIHCDLKPENILLQHAKRSNIKVIDFGSSCRSNNKMYSYIQSRFYRSPEVMLGLPYSTAIDMWSLGCILVEMHTGEPLFAGVDQFDQMCRIVSVLGVTPADVVERSPLTHRGQFFEVDDSNSSDDDCGGDGDDDMDHDAGRSGSDEGREGGSDGDDMSPRINRKTRGGNIPSARTPLTKGHDRRGGGDSGGGGGTLSSADNDRGREEEEEEEGGDDSDHNMAEFSPDSQVGTNNPSPTNKQGRLRYRLRRSLLQKRAKAGDGVGAAGDGPDCWDVPRVPLSEVVGVFTGGPSGRRGGEAGHDPETYGLFVDLVERMLDQRPETRITPAEALLHPFVVDPQPQLPSNTPVPPGAGAAEGATNMADEGGSRVGRPASAGDGRRPVCGDNDEGDEGDDHSISGASPCAAPAIRTGHAGDRSAGGGGCAILTTPDGMQSQLSSAVAEATAAVAANPVGGEGVAPSGKGAVSGLFRSQGQHIDDERGLIGRSFGGGAGGVGGKVSGGVFGEGAASGFGDASVGDFSQAHDRAGSHGYPVPVAVDYGGDDDEGSDGGEGVFGVSGDSPSQLLRPRSEPGRPGTEAAAAAAGGCSEPRHRRCRHHEASSSGGGGRNSQDNIDNGARASQGDVGGNGGEGTNGEHGEGGGCSPGSRVQVTGLRRGRSRGLPADGAVGAGGVIVAPSAAAAAGGKRSGLRKKDDAMMSEEVEEDDSSSGKVSLLPASVLPGGSTGVAGVGGRGLSVETRRGKALREGARGAGGSAAAAPGVADGQTEATSRVARLSLHHSSDRGGGANRGVT